ncbi:MAG: succinylglutamate desuccinylase/aspartoacylase family protein [Patescibacteria group bacterium]
MNKSILFLTCTHGDEQFSVPVIRQLERVYPGRFSWLVVNEQAVPLNRRFVEADMNRIAPGYPADQRYEYRRSDEVQRLASKFAVTLDLHGTPAETGLFAIITNPTPANLLLAATLPLERIVVWAPSGTPTQGPVTQFVPCGLEIECGPRDSVSVSGALYRVLERVVTAGFRFDSQAVRRQQYFRVTGSLPLDGLTKAEVSSLREFTATTIRDREFYPLLINRYPGTACYQMERINI